MAHKYLTIPGFGRLSRQAIFDGAVAHIATTREKSIRESTGRCLYSGTGCNAAPFIRPEMRDDADGVGGWAELAAGGMVPSHHADFVAELQDAHDDVSDEPSLFMGAWRSRMASLAQKYNLNTAKLDAIPA